MDDITKELADFLSRLTFEQIPEVSLEKAKLCILDSIGCALYGSKMPWSKIVNHFIMSQGGCEEATLWTTYFTGPAANVACGIGTMIHSFDYDDYHANKVHPGAVVVPAAFAVGEKEHIDGRTLMVAMVAGYETILRISRGVNPSSSRLRGWHLTGTCGTFAAAATSGRIWKLDPEIMAGALGMAGTQSAGLWAFTADGSWSKRFHPGRSAQSGIIASSLCRAGYKGPTKILEADDGGFFKATSSDSNFPGVVEGLGKDFLTEETVIKPYPACASIHSSLDAALMLRKEYAIPWEHIRQVKVYNSKLVDVQCGFDYQATGILEAQMSLKYCVARALLDGVFSLGQLDEGKLSDPDVMQLANRVTFNLDEEIDRIYPTKWPSRVEILMKDGKNYHKRVDVPRGTAEQPMTRQEVQEKFRTLAEPILGKTNADSLIERVENMEHVPDVSEISGFMKKT